MRHTWVITLITGFLGLGFVGQSHASLVGDTFYVTMTSQPLTIGAPQQLIADLLPVTLSDPFSSSNQYVYAVPFAETDPIRWNITAYASSRSISFVVKDNLNIGPVDIGLVTITLTDLRDQITKMQFDNRFVVPNSIDYSVPHTLTMTAQFGTLAAGTSKAIFSNVVVPESSTLLLTSLAGLGSVGILIVRRRMNKRSA